MKYELTDQEAKFVFDLLDTAPTRGMEAKSIILKLMMIFSGPPQETKEEEKTDG